MTGSCAARAQILYSSQGVGQVNLEERRLKERELEALLRAVSEGAVSPEKALERLRDLPYEDLGFAKVDHHRALRRGFPEAVFGGGKTPDQIAAIVDRIAGRGQNVIVTRATPEVLALLAARHPSARFHEQARCLTVTVAETPVLDGRVAVLCAGTSDVPVAEEAALTAAFHGAEVDRLYDVGVAGLHRLLDQAEVLRAAGVVVVAAGMEGALPSVVAGLVAAPVIAVPTSVGYGASFGGLAALLAMLNACASGIAVVNIDNGFGAGYLAAVILRGRAK
jgi:pyridinium-3,5-biscarboxylic acid mononucleotide synthase